MNSSLSTPSRILRTPSRILIYGRARDLIETRRMVLEHAGFDVVVALSSEKARELLASQTFDLFILCHSLTSDDCQSALSEAHSVRPRMKNLIMSATGLDCAGSPEDAHMTAFADPRALIVAATELTAQVASGN